MAAIPGYDIDRQLWSGERSLIYRARRRRDGLQVVLKLPRAERPSWHVVGRLNREYEIARGLKTEKAAKPLALEHHHQRPVLVFEDIRGVSLREALSGSKDLRTLLERSVELADAIGAIHEEGVLHKDINPSNVIWSRETGRLQIIDFSTATSLSQEVPMISNPRSLEGALAYMAPERTGRMNRDVDRRADLYAFGITLYELFSGELPFRMTDPMELVHAHIAVTPRALHTVDRSVPEVVSAIVMKLLAKSPEARYQTAAAVRADLQACVDRLTEAGTIPEFVIGRDDVFGAFSIPQRLYGREDELRLLVSVCDGVSKGSKALTLISGHPGIGKSALVHEIFKYANYGHGYFAWGKFDQFQRSVPFSAVVSAFRGLVRELLTEPPDALSAWRAQLEEAFGPNGAIVSEVIPEVELIVGPRPPVPVLNPTEAQNRFNLVFQRLIRVFCRPGHPLTLFLDDLQWADSASLKLIELMLSDSETRCLHLIGAYRDNEISSAHPLSATQRHAVETGARVDHIHLGPLHDDDVTQIVVDTLQASSAEVRRLAEHVRAKTSGNPFFVSQFLTALHRKGGLRFDPGAKIWRWEIDAIEALGITENVVLLMVERLASLPPRTRDVMLTCSCMGDQFDLKTLTIILETSVDDAYRALYPAIEEGLVIPLSTAQPSSEDLNARRLVFYYKFLHDRVQQAAHSLLDDEQRRALHARIGRLLFTKLGPAERSERIFELVDHLNTGRAFLGDLSALDLARLNLEAARKAKDATAYAAAHAYAQAALADMSDDMWTVDYPLAVALHKECAEVEYLTGRLDAAEARIRLLLSRVAAPLEQAEICTLLIALYTLSSRFKEALQAGRDALRLVGVDLPTTDIKAAAEAEMQRALDNVGDHSIASFGDLPEAATPETRMAIKLLAKVGPLCFLADQDLFRVVTIRSVNLTLEQGPAPGAGVGLANHGVLLIAERGDYQSGYEFGKLALAISERLNDLAQKCVASMMLGCVLQHWVHPLSHGHAYQEEAIRVGLDVGELVWVGYVFGWKPFLRLHEGEHLDVVRVESERHLELMRSAQHQFAIRALTACALCVNNLTGRTGARGRFTHERTDEAAFLALCDENAGLTEKCYFLTTKAQVLYLYGDYAGSFDCLERANPLLAYIVGTFTSAMYWFHHSMVRAALYADASEAQKRAYREQIAANQRKMDVWRRSCPGNFEDMYLLVEAELLRLDGSLWEAVSTYHKALESSRKYGVVQNQALANELVGRLWLHAGFDEYARAHLDEAAYGYALWGATAKVAAMEEAYPAFVGREHSRDRAPVHEGPPRWRAEAVTDSPEALDLRSIVKASQAISQEIELDKLALRLLQIMKESVGAQLSYLLLSQPGGEFTVVAGVSTDAGAIPDLAYPVPLSTRDPATGVTIVPTTVLRYVARTGAELVVHDASKEALFAADPYIQARKPRSILCVPLMSPRELIGALYLENNLATGVFHAGRMDAVNLLAGQIGISLKNAFFYQDIQAARDVERQQMQEKLIQAQADALAELSTPLIPVSDGVLVMPLIGVVDTQRAARALAVLLEGVSARNAHTAIIDVTGVPIMNAEVAAALVRTAQAVRLLGAHTVLTGIRGEVARTLVELSAELQGIVTCGTLQRGIARAMRMPIRGRRIS